MADAFARWLERVLGERPRRLRRVRSGGKPLVGSVFARELSAPGETAKRAAPRGPTSSRAATTRRSRPPISVLALFRMDGRRRSRAAVRLRRDKLYAQRPVREAADRPAGFSPGVLLRPIVQDTVLPTVCYVAGPSELAYLGQLRGVYERFGVPMPLIYPRATATILDSPAYRFLRNSGVPLEALQPQDDSRAQRAAAQQMPPEVDEAFSAAGAGRSRPDDPRGLRHFRRRSRRSRARRDRRWAACSTTSRRCTARRSRRPSGATRRCGVSSCAPARSRSPTATRRSAPIGFVSFLNQYGPGARRTALGRAPARHRTPLDCRRSKPPCQSPASRASPPPGGPAAQLETSRPVRPLWSGAGCA